MMNDNEIFNPEVWNETLKKTKLALTMLFPQGKGATVGFICDFDRFGSNKRNVCVNKITNFDGYTCNDKDEDGDYAHFWFEDVTAENKKQSELWKKMSRGYTLQIKGTLDTYHGKDEQGNIFDKIRIADPEIIAIFVEENGVLKRIYP